MASKTKKIKAAGKFSSSGGTNIRKEFNAIEAVQRKKQICPHCNRPGVKRIAAGIWNCKKCGKTFAHGAYSLNKQL